MKNHNEPPQIKHPHRLTSYFRLELVTLSIVSLSGILYNIGLTASPYFEGQLAQRLYDVMNGKKSAADMMALALVYLLVILVVQGARCVKRFYVRRFANDTGRNMRRMLYNTLVHMRQTELEQESVGTIMTKAVADVDACVEGMRKFTTEIFDTGIALIAYLVMLFLYDWRLALISCAFPPIAYLMAEKLKLVVYRFNSTYKKRAGALADATLDRITNAITYRVFGRESARDTDYEECLSDYEHAAVAATIWDNTPQPIYQIIAMTGAVFILYFGAKNVMGTGWCLWDIASFTTFLSCFSKMALKSSKVAKLFNAVQKARVSWQRINPLMRGFVELETQSSIDRTQPAQLQVTNLSVAYDHKVPVIRGLSFSAHAGEIIGITGPIACGKSTFGKVLLCETPYSGSVKIGQRELSTLSDYERSLLISYMGHQPELISDTLEENICLGDQGTALPYLNAVCMTDEVSTMPLGIQTFVGNGGIQLSGGQQARAALARALYHKQGILVLDDPFSAVDLITEQSIIEHLRCMTGDCVTLILSHRLSHFPEFDRVVLINDGNCQVGTHASLMDDCLEYASLYLTQMAGGNAHGS